MDVDILRSKLKNLESSLAFLRKEHATTLKSLQDEIQKLQTQNAEFAFQLTMGTSRGSTPATRAGQCRSSSITSAPHRDRPPSEDNDEIVSLKAANKRLQTRLDIKSSRKRELKVLLASFEARLTEETRRYRSELEERNSKIASLLEKSNHYHQQQHREPNRRSGGSSRRGSNTSSISPSPTSLAGFPDDPVTFSLDNLHAASQRGVVFHAPMPPRAPKPVAGGVSRGGDSTRHVLRPAASAGGGASGGLPPPHHYHSNKPPPPPPHSSTALIMESSGSSGAGGGEGGIRVKPSPNVLPPISHGGAAGSLSPPSQLQPPNIGDSIGDDLLVVKSTTQSAATVANAATIGGTSVNSNSGYRASSTSPLPRLERQTLAVQPLTPPSRQFEPNMKPT